MFKQVDKNIFTLLCFKNIAYLDIHVCSHFMMKTLVDMHIGSFKNITPYTVGNMSFCRSEGYEYDPGPVPYFHGD